MDFNLPHVVFLLGTSAYLAIRAVFQYRTASNTKEVHKTSARDRILVMLVGASQIGMPLLLFFTPWLSGANYAPLPANLWLGTAVMLGALWLFWRSHADLGLSWSVSLELNTNHQLITRGVYHGLRHPMYASFFAMGLAQGILLSNWLAGWAALVAVAALYVVRVPEEEKMMLEYFGDEYRAYMRSTGGILPRMRAA